MKIVIKNNKNRTPGLFDRPQCAKYKFKKPGTYFVTLRVTSQRDGEPKTPFARIQHLDRVRVVVQ